MKFRQQIIQLRAFFRTYIHWKRLVRQSSVKTYERPSAPCLVVVPCEPWTVGGSRGDEAMITGVIHRYRYQNSTIPIYIVCADSNGVNYIKGLSIDGIFPIATWNGAYALEGIYNSIIAVRPTDVVLLGADCMDGFYSPSLSLMLLALYDLCSKTDGINSRLLGFSFNEHPSQLMVWAFKSLTSDIQIKLRDSVSLSRFIKKTGRHASLVADAAFMLLPQTDFPLYDEISRWACAQRAEGHTIIGLNFHPMLRKYSGADDIKADALLLAKNMQRILDRYNELSLILIPHDDRSHLTDNLMLSTIYEHLHEFTDYSQRIFYSPEVPRAPQLKGLCGVLDGLISSRMHLAIAALGMKVPVMAATYQGKFEGLFCHFGLSEDYLLNIHQLLSEDMLSIFDKWLADIPHLHLQIEKGLQHVIELSNSNFSND